MSKETKKSHCREKQRTKKVKATKQKRRYKGIDNKIGKDDFFLKAKEFRVWLQQQKGKYVEDLSSEKAMSLFVSKFVKRWNEGRLDDIYYTGIPENMIEKTKRTRYTWKFVSKMNEQEKFDLATTKDSVEVATKKNSLLQSLPKDKEDRTERKDEGERDYDSQQRKERKRYFKDRQCDLEELVPRETGRDAMIEKRREAASRLHTSSREKEQAIDGLDLGEDFLMGGGEKDDLQQRLARRQLARKKKEQERAKIAERALANESARMKKFLEDMGISPGNANSTRITIAPRPTLS